MRDRATALTILLVRLSMRPDVRCSTPFRSFIDFDHHTGVAVTPRELQRGRTALDVRFGVTGLATFADALIAVHTDTTSLSRLGKVWSIVEPDELGSVTIWRLSRSLERTSDEYDPSVTYEKLGDRLFIKLLAEKGNCMKLNATGKVALGMGNGSILLYDIESPGTVKAVIQAHGVSPVIDLDVDKEKIYSIGLDDGLRISEINSGVVLGGGKLSKRLEAGETLTCLKHGDQRVFIGTSKGRVFVYDVQSAGPAYLHTMSMSSYPVRSIFLTDSTLLVGFDSVINVYDLCQKGNEKHMVRKQQIQTMNNIQVHACQILPHSQFIIAGLADGTVAVFSEGTLVYARYFSEDQINVLHCGHSEGAVWIGGDDGRIVECLLPASLSEDAKYASSGIAPENIPPAPAQNTNPVPKLLNTATLAGKSAVLAECESDDDDWNKGLFSA